MKSSKKHTFSLYRFFVILSGIVLYSILPIDIHSGENGFSHIDHHETEYYSVNGDHNPEDEDSNHSNNFFDLVFKETVEEKVPSANTSGPAIFNQGVTHIEAAFVKFSLDGPFLFRIPGNGSKEYTPALKNQPAFSFIVSLLPLAGGISINAP
jgi:hypothetical protein